MHECKRGLLQILGHIVEVSELIRILTILRSHLRGLAIRKRKRPHERRVSGTVGSDVARLVLVESRKEHGARLLNAGRRVDREGTHRRGRPGPFEDEARRGRAGLGPIDELTHECIPLIEYFIDDCDGRITRARAALKMVTSLEPLVGIIKK